MVTNGDNDYSRSFFERIAAVTAADLITFDYYSRYHRSTGETGTRSCTAASAGRLQPGAPLRLSPSAVGRAGVPCERFGQQEGAPVCKQNKLKWCQTDLGANVMRWPRLIRENRRFGDLGYA